MHRQYNCVRSAIRAVTAWRTAATAVSAHGQTRSPVSGQHRRISSFSSTQQPTGVSARAGDQATASSLVNSESLGRGALTERSPATQHSELSQSAATPSSSAPRRRAHESGAVGTPGKIKRPRAKEITVKKKAPWGVQQLRDSWSEDAMSKRDTENMSERIHREYRYHPDERWRQWLKMTAFLTIPCVFFGATLSYYVHTGKPFWQADPQHLLNLLRAADMSPRSKLYPYRLEESYDLPAHVVEYREKHHEARVLREQIFDVTHSAFACLTPEVQRQIEAQFPSVAATP